MSSFDARFTAAVSQCYSQGPIVLRTMMRLRTKICPFESLVRWIPSGGRLLDVGCGSGLFVLAAAIKAEKLHAVGFDTSSSAICLARLAWVRAKVLFPMLSSTAEFLRLSVEDPWPPSTFDVVSIIDVMHHVPSNSQEYFLKTACARVGKNGVLLYKDIANRPIFFALANRLHDLLAAQQWINYRNVDEVEKWAAESGLTLVHAEKRRMYWYLHEARVFRRK